MKKTVVLILLTVLVFGFCSCQKPLLCTAVEIHSEDIGDTFNVSNENAERSMQEEDGVLLGNNDDNSFESPDLLESMPRVDEEYNGIKWEWLSDGSCHVSGVITETTFINLYNGPLPKEFKAGETYYLSYKSDYVRLRLQFKRYGIEIKNTQFFESRTDDIVTLPGRVANITIRLAVSKDDAGTIVDEIIHPKLYRYKPADTQPGDISVPIESIEKAPVYYEEEIEDTVEKIKAAVTEPCLTFLWCTDIHYHSVIGSTVQSDSVTWMTDNMHTLAQKVHFDGLICTGDSVDGRLPLTTEETLDQIDYVMDHLRKINLPLIYAFGNHDDNRYHYEPFTPEELYSQFLSYVVPERISDLSMNGLNYFIDYSQFKIRMFVLDSNYFDEDIANWAYGYSDETAAWFTEQMKTVPKDYSAIGVMHASPVRYNKWKNQDLIYSAIDNYIKHGGNYICTLCGHDHYDYSITEPWLEINLAAAKAHNFERQSYYPNEAVIQQRKGGTISEQLWDVLIIKPESRIIQTIRFGAGEDRQWEY